MVFDEQCKIEVIEENDQNLPIVDCGEYINPQVKQELTDREIKQEIEEEAIHDHDPLSVLQNSDKEDMDNIDIVHHKIEIDDV